MHLSDALLSTPVALTGGAVAAGLLATAGKEIKEKENTSIIPLMGVLGAFIFAAQMINFAIPGTGSSGHVIGGVLLAAFLGPWAAFVTIASVLIIQCLIFADGGLLALGCNLINMGVTTTLIAYPLIYAPIVRRLRSPWVIMLGSVCACVVGLELGAFLVSVETLLSGVSALSWSSFISIMAMIHLPIGVVEGIATAAVIIFVARTRPDLLSLSKTAPSRKTVRRAVLWFAGATAVIALVIVWFASANPDGLEWSIEKVAGVEEIEQEHPTVVSLIAGKISNTTSIMPEYENPLSGIAGAVFVLFVVWCLTSFLIKTKLKEGDIKEGNPGHAE
ncbi:MAG: energy-coupling factor ABC transporter permease [Muribaculaceae bacterium]|nr:energy-coupling factor ABC transporter permease [Muribaculaceae bacterium]